MTNSDTTPTTSTTPADDYEPVADHLPDISPYLHDHALSASDDENTPSRDTDTIDAQAPRGSTTTRVRECIAAAAQYFHDNLTADHRADIRDHWGLSDDMIDARLIGYTGPGDTHTDHSTDPEHASSTSDDNDVNGGTGVVSALTTQGFSTATILKTGLVSHPVISHVYTCGGIAPSAAADLSITNELPDTAITDCHHDVPGELAGVSHAIATGHINTANLDLQAIVDVLAEHPDYTAQPSCWWDRRYTFPYFVDGEPRYVIARSTPESDDIVYGNGLVDCTTRQSLADTPIARELDVPTDALSHVTIDECYAELYRYPDRDDKHHEDVLDTAITDITTALQSAPTTTTAGDGGGNATGDETAAATGYPPDDTPHGTDGDSLFDTAVKHRYGLRRRSPDTAATITVKDIRTIPRDVRTVLGYHDITDDTPLADALRITPPGAGVAANEPVRIVNDTRHTLRFKPVWLPDGADTPHKHDLDPGDELTFTTGTGYHKYTVTVVTGSNADAQAPSDEIVRCGLLAAFDSIDTQTRFDALENWLSGEPGFHVDVAKYVKQTVDRPWIPHLVTEPIFGLDSVTPNAPVIITEGVTDALQAHQHGFPCVAPATTHFKDRHWDVVRRDVLPAASEIIVVMDREPSQAGLHGALRTARRLEAIQDEYTHADQELSEDMANAIDTSIRVGELPLPESGVETDLADFLAEHDADALQNVLENAIPAVDHDEYNADIHDHTTPSNRDDTSRQSTQSPSDRDDEHTTPQVSGTGAESGREDSPADTNATPASHASQQATSTDSPVDELQELTVADVIPWDDIGITPRGTGQLYRGTHPVDEYSDGNYFEIRRRKDGNITVKDYKTPDKTQNAYYYNQFTWLAVAADCDCTDACDCTRPGRHPRGELTDAEMFWAWRHAKTADHIPLSDDAPVPIRATWHVAREHDVLPEYAIPNDFSDDLCPIPPTAFNRVLDLIEAEYGVDPCRDRRETETNKGPETETTGVDT
ncbi:hypothetical protein [Halovenus sp. HT40]|uniref:hypothetical protein n=1 Tax=Halovenus sp. HT40 TaxID=3126691 RepID=UPI00300F5D48